MSHRTAAEGRTGRLDVQSSDGTPLAVWADGQGPPLVLVHGSLSDHTTFDPLVHELRDDLTTFSMDRRGFGASGDAAGYTIQREFEGHCCIEPECAGEAQQSGGSPSWKDAKKGSNHSTVP